MWETLLTDVACVMWFCTVRSHVVHQVDILCEQSRTNAALKALSSLDHNPTNIRLILATTPESTVAAAALPGDFLPSATTEPSEFSSFSAVSRAAETVQSDKAVASKLPPIDF